MGHNSTNENSAEKKLAGLTADLMLKIKNGSRTLEDLHFFNNLPKETLRQLAAGNYELVKPKHKNRYLLEEIFADEDIYISATKGGSRVNFANSGFDYIDPNFKKWGCDTKQPATKRTKIRIFSMFDIDLNFKTMFGGICPDLSGDYSLEDLKISLKKNNHVFKSQEQGVQHVEDNPKYIKKDRTANFFIFTEEVNGKEEVFVADMDVRHRGVVHVRVNLLSDVPRGHECYGHRIMVPAAKTSDTQS